MKLSGRRKDPDVGDQGDGSVGHDVGAAAASARPQTTAPKGRPTPKRDAGRRQGQRGPVAPAPMTSAQARTRRKTLAGPKPSREERQAQKAQRRERMSDRRDHMLAGDEAYLLDRDRGPVRRFVRDVVDARRNLLGLFMPSALGLLFIMMAVPQIQLYISPAMMLLMVAMGVDGVLVARKTVKLVDTKFPDNLESRWKLGLYASGRASQPRRMRAPRPQVRRGEQIS